MPDEIKAVEGDATSALAHTEAEMAKLEVVEARAANWVQIHHVIIFVALAFIVGSISGYFLH